MTVGNLKLADQNKDKNKKLIAYMPELGGTKTQRETKKYKNAKNRIYHEALERILQSVKVHFTNSNSNETNLAWHNALYATRRNVYMSQIQICT